MSYWESIWYWWNSENRNCGFRMIQNSLCLEIVNLLSINELKKYEYFSLTWEKYNEYIYTNSLELLWFLRKNYPDIDPKIFLNYFNMANSIVVIKNTSNWKIIWVMLFCVSKDFRSQFRIYSCVDNKFRWRNLWNLLKLLSIKLHYPIYPKTLIKIWKSNQTISLMRKLKEFWYSFVNDFIWGLDSDKRDKFVDLLKNILQDLWIWKYNWFIDKDLVIRWILNWISSLWVDDVFLRNLNLWESDTILLVSCLKSSKLN